MSVPRPSRSATWGSWPSAWGRPPTGASGRPSAPTGRSSRQVEGEEEGGLVGDGAVVEAVVEAAQTEADALVEPDGRVIRVLRLEPEAACLAGARVCDDGVDQRSPDAAPPRRWRDVEAVQLGAAVP